MSAIDWDKVIDELRRRGWSQGRLANADGNVCLLGACLLVASPLRKLRDFDLTVDYDDDPVFIEANRALAPIIREFCPEIDPSSFEDGDHVWEFNDWPGTNLDERDPGVREGAGQPVTLVLLPPAPQVEARRALAKAAHPAGGRDPVAWEQIERTASVTRIGKW